LPPAAVTDDARRGGLNGNVIRITPPMTATEEDVAVALDLLDRAFQRVRV